MKPTIKDVARKANVSVATVSRVLNDQPGFSSETREKVLRVIEEIGYHPNALARGLVGKSTKTIGVLIPNISSMVEAKILRGIEDAAHKKNHSVIICNTDNDGERTTNYLEVLRERQVDGLLVISELLTKEYVDILKEMKIPVILISTIDDEGYFKYIKVDDEKAAYQATEYLILKGHQKIAMISGTKDDRVAGIPRVRGYRQAMKNYGLPVADENIIYGDFSFNSGRECMQILLKQFPEMTAVFAASDEMAAGVLSVAYERGLKIPEELSVVGYDNTQLGEMTIPPLTTLSQPLYHMGLKGLDLLISAIMGEDIESLIVPHVIVERQTVKELK
jgi:LacI family transcriptional regulator